MDARHWEAVGAGAVFGAVIASLGRDIGRGLKAQEWPIAPGEITHSHLALERSRRQRLYKPYVVYEYRVGGHTYEGRTLFFGFDTFYTKRAVRRRVEAFSRGQAVNVFYDPGNPSRSVLQPGVTLRTWLVTLGGATAVVLMEYALLFH